MATSYKSREEVPNQYKWNLNDIYTSWEQWEKDFEMSKKKIDDLASYKGKLKDKETLLEFYNKEEELDKLSYKLYRYPQLQRDVDSSDIKANENLQKVQTLFSDLATKLSWLNPELLGIGEEEINKWLLDERFKPYRFGLENLFRLEKHVLAEDKSELMSFYSQFNSSPRTIYSELSVSDVKWPTITLSTGEEIEATHVNYSKTLNESQVQEDRKKMFEAHYQTFKDKENTYSAIYNSILQRSIANKKAYNYDTFLDGFLEGDNIPKEVYLNLIETAKKNSEPLKRYVSLRKKLLKLDNYHTYDGSVSLVNFTKSYDYEDAKKLILESVDPLGEEYKEKLSKAMDNGWVDVYETQGKRSGAYSAGVYGVHPYMLMNYSGTMDSVFTLAHELGHTLHTLYSNENQPFATHDYTIFVAEVASTFNERLLLDDMLEKTTDPKERIALLEQAIKNIVGTFYFQSLLADYEYQAHKLVDEGQPITANALSDIMKGLFKEYYGDEILEDEILNVVWARIPHFYNSPFYVYQYATCFASSSVLYNNVVLEKNNEKREENRKKYIELLSSGGNDHPMNQLKKVGVDLEKTETVEAVSKQLDNLLDLLEVEIEKIN